MRDLASLNLNALRVFSVAARCGSFTEAAVELHVSQSAVSKQVSALETQIGEKLFHRTHRRIKLTEDGHRLADIASDMLKVLEDGLRVRPRTRLDQIRLTCDADFAQLWLLPRLPTFEKMNPDLRVSIKPVVALNYPPEGSHDCAIIWGRGTWKDQTYAPLMTNTVFPVAAPGFFDHLDRAPRAEDIFNEMLIHDQSIQWWTAFRTVTRSRSFDHDAGRIYGQTALCLEAAANAMGVAIGDEVSTRGYLESGKLEPVLNLRLPAPDAYFFLRNHTGVEVHALNQFERWLIDCANQHHSKWARYWAERPTP